MTNTHLHTTIKYMKFVQDIKHTSHLQFYAQRDYDSRVHPRIEVLYVYITLLVHENGIKRFKIPDKMWWPSLCDPPDVQFNSSPLLPLIRRKLSCLSHMDLLGFSVVQ